MRLTQGTFSFLPDFTDEEIRKQVQYCLDNDWAVSIEHTDDPHPRNVYWDMWGQPLFDQRDPDAIVQRVVQCRREHPRHYVRVNGYDRRFGRQTTALSFIVNRPHEEPGFQLLRAEGRDRQVRYTLSQRGRPQPGGTSD